VNDDTSFEPSDQRAEDALRHSFERDRGWSDQVINTDSVRRRARRRSRLRIAGTALAVVVIAGGVGTGVELGSGGNDSSTGPTNSSQQLPPPDDGWRWDFYRDIRIQVPDAWGYGQEPKSDWCVGDPQKPPAPYVALTPPGLPVLAILCRSNSSPTTLWAPHVTLMAKSDSDAPVGTTQVDDWWIVRRDVGAVAVKVVSKDRDLAEQIAAGAQAVTDDSSGCSPHSAIQDSRFPRPDPAFDIASVDAVESISVCEYTLSSPDEPGLLAMRTITGTAATTELHALQAAPVGGGPDRPENCTSDISGELGLELVIDTGDARHSMYVYYAHCTNNGFDDGTHLRELTTDACVPLIDDPIVLWSGSSASIERCYPPRD